MNKNVIRMRTSTFKIFCSNTNLSQLKYQGEFVEFRVSDATRENFKKEKIPFTLIKSYYNEKTVKNNLGFGIGVALFCIISMINVNSIKEIEFSSKAENEKEIIEYLDNHIIEVFGVSVLKTDIITINNLLRSEFIDYEWISVVKDGRHLMININDSPLDDLVISDNTTPGNLVTYKNGIIKLLDVRKGKPMFNYNQHVSYGDLLVTGALSDKDFVHAEGFVIAETLERKTYSIYKETTETKNTGKVIEKIKISIFGNTINDKIPFDNCIQDTKIVFNIPGVMEVKKVQYIEKDDIINVYNIDTVEEYIYSRISEEFLSNKVHPFESIKEIFILSNVEEQDKFIISTLTRKYENIANFKGEYNFESN